MSEQIAHALVWTPTAICLAVAMDFWAAFLHGRVWHSWLWSIHRSHHEPRRGDARFERNDALSLLHAPIAVALILYGCRATPSVAREVAFGVGIGMSVFGLSYLVVHDGLVHGRLPVQWLLRVRYFRHIARAHRVHHANVAAGAPFGLFFGRWELARTVRLTRSRRTTGPIRGSSAPRPSRRAPG
jgi:beta-carotene 3-hydroxylase